MFDGTARKLRDISLMLALIVFLAGLGDVLFLTFDISLTGTMARTGMQPGSFLRAAELLAVLSVAFGIIELSRSRATVP